MDYIAVVELKGGFSPLNGWHLPYKKESKLYYFLRVRSNCESHGDFRRDMHKEFRDKTNLITFCKENFEMEQVGRLQTMVDVLSGSNPKNAMLYRKMIKDSIKNILRI